MSVLGILGRERALVDAFTNKLHREAQRHHDYAPIRKTSRGNTFEVMLKDGGKSTGRVVRVTVELDRVEQVEP